MAPIYQNAFKTCSETEDLAWAEGTLSRSVEIIPDSNGNNRVYDVIKVPIHNPDRSLKGLVVFGRDITEFKTRQLLAFARKQTIKLELLDLNDTISGMLKMLQRLVGEDIELHWSSGRNLWSVKMDPAQIDQILANLVVNSRDAISGTGIISIRTENVYLDSQFCSMHPDAVPGDYVLLTMSDNGSGMSKNIQGNIFEPFFTTKEAGKGTGLGLATVYGIVKQNQGHDEETIMRLGKRILEKLGYDVLTTNTPGEAMLLAETHDGNIHLLITDVVMPQMNGRELAERLTFIKPGLRSLFMSGYTANVIAHHGVLDEDVHFIQKPFSVRRLAEMVREILDA
jgi:CheY-like chemotaxis protein